LGMPRGASPSVSQGRGADMHLERVAIKPDTGILYIPCDAGYTDVARTDSDG